MKRRSFLKVLGIGGTGAVTTSAITFLGMPIEEIERFKFLKQTVYLYNISTPFDLSTSSFARKVGFLKNPIKAFMFSDCGKFAYLTKEARNEI